MFVYIGRYVCVYAYVLLCMYNLYISFLCKCLCYCVACVTLLCVTHTPSVGTLKLMSILSSSPIQKLNVNLHPANGEMPNCFIVLVTVTIQIYSILQDTKSPARVKRGREPSSSVLVYNRDHSIFWIIGVRGERSK